MSTWGEMKTAWHVMLGDLADKITDWEFGEYVDSAQIYLTSIIPEHLIPEMVAIQQDLLNSSIFADKYACKFATQRPNTLQMLSLSLDQTTAGLLYLTPLYHGARKVPFDEFMEVKDYLNEKVWTETSSIILANKEPGSNYDGSKRVLITYKKTPDKYYYKTGGAAQTLMFYGKRAGTDPTNYIYIYDEVISMPARFDSLGLTPSVFSGGKLVQLTASFGSVSDPFANLTTTGTIYPVDIAYDSPDRGVIEVDNRYSLPNLDNTICILIAPPTGSDWSTREDNITLDLDTKWHDLILYHACSRAMLKLGQFDKSQLYDRKLIEGLRPLGIAGIEAVK